MPAWRRQALDRFPDLAHQIATGNSSVLASLLSHRLVEALQSGDYRRGREVVAYLVWVVRHPNPMGAYLEMDALGDAVRRDRVRAELWKAMSREEFEALLSTFCAVAERDAAREFEREFRFTVR